MLIVCEIYLIGVLIMEKKKSTYNPESQKRYEQKRKKLAVSVFNADYEKIIAHMKEQGFNSVNSYLKYLIKKDMGESI